MRALVQRVHWAEVEVASVVVGQVRQGLLVYAGVAPADTVADAQTLAQKIVNLRIFSDDDGKLNRTLQDVRGGVLAISNFTLLADARKGRRPAFTAAATATLAKPLHEAFVHALRAQGATVACGVFGADMIIRSAADGPVNILLDVPAPEPAEDARPAAITKK
ncbi:MAG: D-aminoacyl-tRNA deacylase [Phycisphaerae bacterium]|nr:D-aminoacyl-tRNA deacylase [Phycisphaerae bacterium]